MYLDNAGGCAAGWLAGRWDENSARGPMTDGEIDPIARHAARQGAVNLKTQGVPRVFGLREIRQFGLRAYRQASIENRAGGGGAGGVRDGAGEVRGLGGGQGGGRVPGRRFIRETGRLAAGRLDWLWGVEAYFGPIAGA